MIFFDRAAINVALLINHRSLLARTHQHTRQTHLREPSLGCLPILGLGAHWCHRITTPIQEIPVTTAHRKAPRSRRVVQVRI